MKGMILRNLGVALLMVSSGAHAVDAVAPATGAASSTPLQSKASRMHSDARLRRTVYRAIRHAGGVATAAMTIRVRNGRVILEGTVPDASQVSQAATVSQSVPGVTSVENRLRVDVEEN